MITLEVVPLLLTRLVGGLQAVDSSAWRQFSSNVRHNNINRSRSSYISSAPIVQ
jgi:hypothetical protein